MSVSIRKGVTVLTVMPSFTSLRRSHASNPSHPSEVSKKVVVCTGEPFDFLGCFHDVANQGAGIGL
jgi:hypothetical protein